MLSKWSRLCLTTSRKQKKKKKVCDCYIPAWWLNELLMLLKWQNWFDPLLSSHLYCLSSSARVTISFPDSFPNLFSLPPFACRIGDREEWTVKGDDPCLPPLSLSPSLSLAFSSLSQHYKAPCPLWLLTLTWARKRLRSGLACVRYREGERGRVCVCVWVFESIYVCARPRHKSTTKQSNDCWVVV